MIYSSIGYYSLIFGLCASLPIFFFAIKNFKNDEILDSKIISFSFIQLILVVVSFLGLIISFVISDFSNETVYNNSHTTKPLFYKISGTWGNHEGSLLLWLLVLSLFIFIFLLDSSNPFNHVFPTPTEGLGLNPILQDPALAIHPPMLYLGYVGSSIIFSSVLAAT